MSQSKKNLYEGMYVISATLSDDARNKALEKIQNGITSRNGEILKIHDQGKKKLAYEIEGHREGYYFIMYFNLPTPSVSEIWKEYHLNEDLIRFITLKVEEVVEKFEFKSLVEQ